METQLMFLIQIINPKPSPSVGIRHISFTQRNFVAVCCIYIEGKCTPKCNLWISHWIKANHHGSKPRRKRNDLVRCRRETPSKRIRFCVKQWKCYRRLGVGLRSRSLMQMQSFRNCKLQATVEFVSKGWIFAYRRV